MDELDSEFKCFNCGKIKLVAERSHIPAFALALSSAVFLIVAKSFRWPSNVCKSCENQVYLFSAIGAILLLCLTYAAV
jgi:transcription elongation factor Elf1